MYAVRRRLGLCSIGVSVSPSVSTGMHTCMYFFIFSNSVEVVIKYYFFYFCVCLFLVWYLFIYGSFFFWRAISVNFHVCICMLGPRHSPVGGGPRERFVLCT